MLLLFKREKGGTFFNRKRIEMALEIVQKLPANEGYTEEDEKCDILSLHWTHF